MEGERQTQKRQGETRKLCELLRTHKALAEGFLAGCNATPTLSPGGLRHYLSLPPTLTALPPAHIHLRHSYTLTHPANAFTDHNSLSPPHTHTNAHSHALHTHMHTDICTLPVSHTHSPADSGKEETCQGHVPEQGRAEESVLTPCQAQPSALHAELGLPRSNLYPLMPGPSQALGVMGAGEAPRNMPGMC